VVHFLDTRLLNCMVENRDKRKLRESERELRANWRLYLGLRDSWMVVQERGFESDDGVFLNVFYGVSLCDDGVLHRYYLRMKKRNDASFSCGNQNEKKKDKNNIMSKSKYHAERKER